MSNTQHSDVIVIGGHLGGLFTAALLSRQGLRCTIVGHGELESGQTEDAAHMADWPFLLADYEADSATQQVIETLGMRQDLRRVLPVESPMLQFIDSDERLDIFDDPQQRAQELNRALNESGSGLQKSLLTASEHCNAISRWFNDVPALTSTHFWNSGKLKQQLDKANDLQGIMSLFAGLDAAGPLRKMLNQIEVFSGHCPTDDTPDLIRVRAASRVLLATRHAEGGERKALAEMAAQFCTQHGSKILDTAKVENIQLSRNEIIVQLSNQSASYTSAFVVDASRYFEFAELIAKPRQAEAFRKNQAQMQQAAWVHSFYLVLKSRGLPQGLASKAIVHSADGQNVLVTCDHGGRKRQADDDMATVSASVVGPSAQPSDAEIAFLRALLIELMPFCEPFIKTEKIGSSRPLWKQDHDADALGPRRGVKTSHPRILHVGSDVLPAWGIEGELRAARELAKIISAKVKKT